MTASRDLLCGEVAGVLNEEFFDDLEGQLFHLARWHEHAQVLDEVQAENTQVSLECRLRAARGRSVGMCLSHGEHRRGRVLDVGPGWVMLGDASASTPTGLRVSLPLVGAVVRLAAVEAVEGLTHHYVRADSGTAAVVGRTLNAVVRLAESERRHVGWRTLSGSRYSGALQSVAKDHVLLTRSGGDVVALALRQLAVLDVASGINADPTKDRR